MRGVRTLASYVDAMQGHAIRSSVSKLTADFDVQHGAIESKNATVTGSLIVYAIG
jgi:hypothetical protein